MERIKVQRMTDAQIHRGPDDQPERAVVLRVGDPEGVFGDDEHGASRGSSMSVSMVLVSGARPNLMKVSALWHALTTARHPFTPVFVHTGQHYDYELSRVFYGDLGLSEPDVCLKVGSGSHGEQTGRIMVEFERICLERSPDLVVVVGDVNSTLACALVAVKLGIPVAHVEAGLRSFDRSMPEEINRVVTDAISRYLFTPSRDADENLKREGIPSENIFFVGNVMVDTLLRYREKAEAMGIWREYGVAPGAYGVLTLHRPSNVDHRETLHQIFEGLGVIQQTLPVIFPAHPRTMARIQDAGLGSRLAAMKNVCLVKPLGYVKFIGLMSRARFVLTDSGGIQEETTVLGVPCLTLRENTERPVTLVVGTNRLVKPKMEHIIKAVKKLEPVPRSSEDGLPELWDGGASDRIVSILARAFS